MNKNQINQILKRHHRFLRTNGAEGERANFREADLAGANLSQANLDGANLKGAILSWAILDGAELAGAELAGANLKGANLDRAVLNGAILDGASLTGAILTGTILEKKKKTVSSPVSSNVDLRAKFDEFAKSLGLKIISLKVEKEKIVTETIDL